VVADAAVGISGFLMAVTLAVLLEARSFQDAATHVAIFGILLGPWWIVLIATDARQTLRATEEGLEVYSTSPKQAQRAMWNDARLFAVTGPGRSGSPPVSYEVSSAAVKVRWVRIQPTMPHWFLQPRFATEPTVSIEEYDRKMEQLLGLITARTGLPLYDLREGVVEAIG
jgi:hypothetical protein